MFSKNLIGFIFCLGLGVANFSSSAFAESNEKSTSKPSSSKSKSSIKVAYIDIQEAILKTEEGKAARDKIENDAKKKRDEIVNQEKALKKIQDEFMEQSSVLSETAKADKQKDFQKKYEQYNKARTEFDQEIREKERTETDKIIVKMREFIDELAKKRGYDFVFERSSGLLYAVNPEDITEDVVKAYNNRAKK